jgi:HNH endonuclease
MPRGQPWLPAHWDAYVRDRYICQYCGLDARALGRHDLHCPDHLVPRNAGGPDDLDNLVVSCAGCNILKGKCDLRNDELGLPRDELIRRARKRIEKQSRMWQQDFRLMLHEGGREIPEAEVLGPLGERAHVIGPLTMDEHRAIREAAASRGIDAAALILQWIRERLRRM